jgi:hypothetical protein
MDFSKQLFDEMVQFRFSSLRPVNLHIRENLESSLRFLYHVMRASEGLLNAALRSPIDSPLRDYYFKHFKEEHGHGEWMRRDLDVSNIMVKSIPRQSISMVGICYYMIFHVDTAALLGYMLAVEGFPPTVKELEDLEVFYPDLSLSCLKHHASVDPGHLQELFSVIDSRDEDEHWVIREAAMQATSHICNFTQTLSWGSGEDNAS